MNKFIIENRTELSDLEMLNLVLVVVKGGKVSNNGKQYCYGTRITYDGNEYMVSSILNKKSERFVIWNDKTIK